MHNLLISSNKEHDLSWKENHASKEKTRIYTYKYMELEVVKM